MCQAMFNCHPDMGLGLGLGRNNSRGVNFCSLSLKIHRAVDQEGRVW